MNAKRFLWPFTRRDRRLNTVKEWQREEREQREIDAARSRLLGTAATTREWNYRRDDEAQP